MWLWDTITRNCVHRSSPNWVLTISSCLNCGRPAPREGGLRRGEIFWLRLTTASAQFLRLSGRFFHPIWNWNAKLHLHKIWCGWHWMNNSVYQLQEAQLRLTNPHDASPNMVPFGMLGVVFISVFVRISWTSCPEDTSFLRYSTSKNVVTLKSGSEVTQDNRNWYVSIRHLGLPINLP